jgi:hypothetical protein
VKTITLSVLTFAWLSCSGVGFAQAADVCTQHNFLTRPIPLGVCGSNLRVDCRSVCRQGTLGALVKDSAGIQYILSNNHVLADGNEGQAGDSVSQPDCDHLNAGVANLTRFVPLSTTGSNSVDAAIAKVVAGKVDTSGSILNIGQVSTTPGACVLYGHVEKMSCTTCHMPGTIFMCSAGFQTSDPCLGNLTFTNQIEIIMSTQPGDSGSLVVTQGTCHQPIGLIFGISPGNTVGWANPIGTVLNALGVTMVGSSCTAPSAPPNSSTIDIVQQTWEPSPEQIRAGDVVNAYGPTLLAIPGVWGYGVRLDQNGAVIIAVLVDALTLDLQNTIPSELGGFRVEISQEDRPVLAGAPSSCRTKTNHMVKDTDRENGTTLQLDSSIAQ